MPTVLNIYGLKFYFYSNEESRMHIHVAYDGNRLKIWLDTFEIAENKGFNIKQMNRALKIVRKNEEKFKKAWETFFKDVAR